MAARIERIIDFVNTIVVLSVEQLICVDQRISIMSARWKVERKRRGG
jgi:hypothetical protein